MCFNTQCYLFLFIYTYYDKYALDTIPDRCSDNSISCSWTPMDGLLPCKYLCAGMDLVDTRDLRKRGCVSN